MLYREIMAVCSEIHTKHINTQMPRHCAEALPQKTHNCYTPAHCHMTKCTAQRSSRWIMEKINETRII